MALALDSIIYDVDGSVIEDPYAVGKAFAEERAPKFGARPLMGKEVEWLRQSVPRRAGLTKWTSPRGRLRGIAAQMPRLEPGPDGHT